MNKAFVREGDAPPPRCPDRVGCGQPGLPVPPETIAAQLSADEAARFTSDAYYCPNPACAVGYYDAWGGHVPVTALARVTAPKDPGGAICACLGIAAADVVAEAKAGGKDLVVRIIAHARGAEARCATASPAGRSCEREVRRVYGNARQGSTGSSGDEQT